MIDIFESAVDATGRNGAAFERDDETAFFYLLDLTKPDDQQIVEAFDMRPITDTPPNTPVSLQWAASGEAVGLYAGGDLVALFDLQCEGRKGRWATDEDIGLFARH